MVEPRTECIGDSKQEWILQTTAHPLCVRAKNAAEQEGAAVRGPVSVCRPSQPGGGGPSITMPSSVPTASIQLGLHSGAASCNPDLWNSDRPPARETAYGRPTAHAFQHNSHTASRQLSSEMTGGEVTGHDLP